MINRLKLSSLQLKYVITFHLCSHLSFQGLEKIEYLQNHENQEIYRKAFDMVEKYFSGDETDATLDPQITGQQYTFNPDIQQPPGGFTF